MSEKITVRELAELAKVSQQTAYSWVWSKKIPAQRNGIGEWSINKSDALDYIKARKGGR